MAAAIEENAVDFFILHSKSQSKLNDHIPDGQVYRIRERKIFIEIFNYSFRKIQKNHKQELYDISFILNRMPYQVQHQALDFIEKEDLFTKLINNSYYKCKSASLPLANGKKQTYNHQFK